MLHLTGPNSVAQHVIIGQIFAQLESHVKKLRIPVLFSTASFPFGSMTDEHRLIRTLVSATQNLVSDLSSVDCMSLVWILVVSDWSMSCSFRILLVLSCLDVPCCCRRYCLHGWVLLSLPAWWGLRYFLIWVRVYRECMMDMIEYLSEIRLLTDDLGWFDVIFNSPKTLLL